MTNYKELLKNNKNQLINIIDCNNNSEEYLLFIYYTCCILGGYDSIDYLIHLLVFNIIKCINIDLNLYYPDTFDIELRMNETLQYYNHYSETEIKNVNNFLANLKYNDKLKHQNYDKIKRNNGKLKQQILENTSTLRGFNQIINYRKLFLGNKSVVKNYFINNIDIKIMKKIIKIYHSEDIIKIFKVYFQVPQIMHPTYSYPINRNVLLKEYNICVNSDNYKKNKPGCIEKDFYKETNLMVSLMLYSDCREMALILEFYHCMKEWLKYVSYLKNFKKNESKIVKLIINQKRIISMDVYFDAININEYNELITTPKFVKVKKRESQLTYNNNYYKMYENHVCVIKMKKKDNYYKFKINDVMYNKYDLKLLNTKFIGEYIMDNKKIKINYPYLDFGKNDFDNSVSVISKIKKLMFINFTYIDNLSNKFLFLSQKFDIPENFYDVDKFIKNREIYYHMLKNKYLIKKSYMIEHYNGNSEYLKYFLLSDL